MLFSVSFGFNSKANDFNDGWKMMNNSNGSVFSMPHNNSFAGFNKGVYSSPYVNNNNVNHNNNNNNVNNINLSGYKSGFKVGDEFQLPNKGVKKNSNNNGSNKKHGDNTDVGKTSVDKKFKTLPPSESLPRNETIGGYIFVCNNDTMAENLKRQIFGLPPRYRDSVRTITPGLPLFLYNYSTHQLHSIFEAILGHDDEDLVLKMARRNLCQKLVGVGCVQRKGQTDREQMIEKAQVVSC